MLDAFFSFHHCLSESESEEQRGEMLKKFERFQHLAELYHVYRSIQRYTVRILYTLSQDNCESVFK